MQKIIVDVSMFRVGLETLAPEAPGQHLSDLFLICHALGLGTKPGSGGSGKPILGLIPLGFLRQAGFLVRRCPPAPALSGK